MTTIDWLIVAGYFLALLWIGWRERKSFSGSASAIILGGRALTLPAFVATLVTTWYGGILGVGEYTYSYGVSSWVVFGLPYYLGALAFALFLAKVARRSETVTIPGRIRETLGEKSSLVSAVLVFVTTAPTAYLLMLAILISFFFGISVTLAALLAALFSLVYVFLGGFRAVVRTDKAQFALMFGGFLLLFVLLYLKYGFVGFLGGELPASHLSATGGASWWYIASWYIIAQGALVEPGFHQRCYAAKTEKVAKRGILISILFWILFDFLTTATGLYARALLPDLVDPALAFPELALAVLPPVALGLFVTSMLAVVMSTIDSNSFIAATTFSHDIILPLKNDGMKNDNTKTSSSLARWTRIGLIVSTTIALLFTLVFDSIVEVWREFGSVIMPALLLPTIIAFSPDKKFLRPSDRQGAALIAIPALVSIGWILYRYFGPHGAYPFSDYPFLAEPIFPGLYSSLALFGLFVLIRKIRGR